MDRSLKSAITVKIGKRFSDKRISLSLSLEDASKLLFINVDFILIRSIINDKIWPL